MITNMVDCIFIIITVGIGRRYESFLYGKAGWDLIGTLFTWDKSIINETMS